MEADVIAYESDTNLKSNPRQYYTTMLNCANIHATDYTY